MATAAAAVTAGGRSGEPIGLAVSGGSDSMAMLHLMAQVAPQAGVALRVVTVDHRLRPEAAAEAAFVADVCAGLGLQHAVLVWEHGAMTGNLMEAAAEARYRLIGDWARGQGIGQVVLAHTADDQAEGLLIGLSRAAGLDGLAGMRPEWVTGGVTFRRPFLQYSRARLREVLQGRALAWVEDPTNADDRYTRVRARKALTLLQPLGITAAGLAAVTGHLAMAKAALDQVVVDAAAAMVTESAGSLRLDRQGFAPLAPEVQRRMLLAMLRWIGGAAHPPRAAKLAALMQAVALGRDATLGGLRFRWRDDLCTISREARAVGGPVAVGALWDGRWRVTGGAGEVRALGAEGLRLCPDWRKTGLARQVLEVTPGLWQGGRLIAAPLAGFGTGEAICEPSFKAFLLSH